MSLRMIIPDMDWRPIRVSNIIHDRARGGGGWGLSSRGLVRI